MLEVALARDRFAHLRPVRVCQPSRTRNNICRPCDALHAKGGRLARLNLPLAIDGEGGAAQCDGANGDYLTLVAVGVVVAVPVPVIVRFLLIRRNGRHVGVVLHPRHASTLSEHSPRTGTGQLLVPASPRSQVFLTYPLFLSTNPLIFYGFFYDCM